MRASGVNGILGFKIPRNPRDQMEVFFVPGNAPVTLDF